jgi:hypothetical protein
MKKLIALAALAAAIGVPLASAAFAGPPPSYFSDHRTGQGN